MLTEGQEPIPGYKLEKFLGRGQFGEVWRAKSPGGTHVALKFLNVRERQGRKEFRAIQKIKEVRHPHLVQTYALWLLDDQMRVIDDAGFENASPSMLDSFRATMLIDSKQSQASLKPSMLVIATVLCEQNLMERLQDWQHRGESGIPIPELIGYLEDAAKAIDFLNAPRHELGDGPVAIYHCDIKPENIMILGDLAVVGDFGVARILRSGGNETRGTTMGGSIAYAPPESFENKTESTSDQYALAITYYELRTGKLPFQEETAASVMKDKQLGKLDFSAVNPKERSVLQKATSVQPSKRFPTARQFVEALQNAALNRPTSSGKKASGLFWLFGLLILAAGPIAYLSLMQRGSLKEVDRDRDKEDARKKASVDAAMVFDSALAIVRKSSYDENILHQATVEAVKSIEAGYAPTMPEAIGNISIGIDSFVDDAISLVSIRPDGLFLVAGHDQQLDFYRLAGSERMTMTLEGLAANARLTKLVWLSDKIVMLDDHNEIRFVALTEPPSVNTQSPTKIMIEARERPFASWASSEFRDGLLLLKGQYGGSIGLTPKPGVFECEWWSNVDSVGDSKDLRQLELGKEEPFALGSDNGHCFVVLSQDRSRITLGKLWDRMDGTVVDLKPDLSNHITRIHAVRFLEDGQRLVVAGETKSGDQAALLVFVHADHRWSIETTSTSINESMARMVIVDDNQTFYVGRGSQLSRWLRDESGQWVADELAQFEDSLNSSLIETPESAKAVKTIHSHPSGWLFSGHEDGKLMIVKLDGPHAKVRFEIVRVGASSSEIEQVSVINDRLLVLTKDGTLAWYDLRECLLVAEACLQTGKTPKPITETPPVSQ